MTLKVESVSSKANSGFLWSAAERWSAQIFSFVALVVLARLLTPESFGVVATATILVSSCLLITEQGLGDALVQRREVDDLHYSSVFWLNLAIAAVCAVALFGAAGILSSWLKMPKLIPVIQVLSVVPLINATSKVHEAMLRRNLEFRGLAVRRVASSFVGLIVAITTALFGFGAMSLVFQQITAETVGCIVLWHQTAWRPSIAFSKVRIQQLLGFGTSMFILSIVTMLNTRVDDMAISINLGAAVLGIYTVAYGFLRAINGGFNGIVLRVAFSQFCRLQDQAEAIKAGFRGTFRMAAYSGFIVFTLLALGANDLIHLMFGQKWRGADVIMRILTLSAFFQLPTSFIMVYLRSVGFPHLNTGFMIGLVAILALGVFGFVGYGIVAVAWVVTGVTILGFFVALYLGARVSALRFSWFGTALFLASIASGAAATGGLLVKCLLSTAEGWLRLSLSSLCGFFIYLAVVLACDKELREKIGSLLWGFTTRMVLR